jgi:hypothetical protein
MDQACPGFDHNSIDWLPFVDSRWNIFFREGLQQALDNKNPGDA